MKKTVSVLDFGALGDGVHDDFFAIQSALDSGAEKIIIPQGVYPVSSTLKVGSNTEIFAHDTAKIVMKGNERKKRKDFLLSNANTEKGNVNIKIVGGLWDGNNTSPQNAKPDIFEKNGYSGVLLNFVKVKGLCLCDAVLANSVTYYVRMSGVHDFEICNISLFSDKFGANQDGIHLGGDTKHGIIKNIRALSYGQSNDDMIALNADDSVERVENLDLARDDIEDITIENIYTENCHTIIRMLSVTAKIENIRIKNIYGGFRCFAINADGARYCRTPLFKEEEYPHGIGKIKNITIENFTCFPVFENPSDFGGTKSVPKQAIILESHAENFKIKDFEYITDKTDVCPALVCKNLTNQKVKTCGKEAFLCKKDEELVVKNFKDLSLDLF